MSLLYDEKDSYPEHALRFRGIGQRRRLDIPGAVLLPQCICALLIWAVWESGGALAARGDLAPLLRLWLPIAACFVSAPWIISVIQRDYLPRLQLHTYRNLTLLGLLDVLFTDANRLPDVFSWRWYQRGSTSDLLYGLRPGRDSLRGRLDALLARYEAACRNLRLLSEPAALYRQTIIGLIAFVSVMIFFAVGMGGRRSPPAPWMQDILDWLVAFPGTPWALALLAAPLLGVMFGRGPAAESAKATALADALDDLWQRETAAQPAAATAAPVQPADDDPAGWG